ncbi:aquaporin-11 [Falco biarmicus]|uniref:Aquaporin 11 n=1 Tax=Falco tinnunculus TaxID=100819 RepID=A0A8C4U753_FALTI|nr:aquaporin-11 [Falco cherrug]XP_037232268.1 aquaporin-11 [Falco rusticolus]XP_040439371.1 aquaporin-11 [Falco naumanni]XP_056184111.1 aquaporin-11 [Falco biarmicus]
MAAGGAGTSLLLMAGITVTVGLCRRLTRRRLRAHPRLCTFLLEMFSTFQVCACTNELCLLGNVEPKPHAALTFTYGFTVLHGLTLTGSTCNPCGTLQPMWGGGTSVKMGGLKIAAQFVAAVLARVFMNFIWSLGMAEPHFEALSQGCSNPMQTTETQAFCIELLFSVVFQLTILRVESVNPKYKVHLIALLITMLVYAGGNLTGAIFNPALAFSLHAHCFYDKFLSYSLVYWIAPSLGTILVAFIWDEILPRIS